MIPMRRTWYVKPRGTRWSVIRQDGIHAESLHDHKDDAIARGLELSQRHRGRLRVKGTGTDESSSSATFHPRALRSRS